MRNGVTGGGRVGGDFWKIKRYVIIGRSLSLPIFNANMMLEVLLNELCKRIRNLDFA